MTRPAALLALTVAAAAAALAPLLRPAPSAAAPAGLETWPGSYRGRPIAAMAPAAEDALLAAQFPGRIARFSDGRRQIVLRRLDRATRRLHPASDCFRATGHAIAPAPMRIHPDGSAASCFRATRAGRSWLVCEQVEDGAGRTWPDISSWYWAALLGSSEGPWQAAMTVEAAPDSDR